jgi:hypothetical protein
MPSYSFTTIGSTGANAYGINDAGDVVGTLDASNGFVYKNGSLTTLVFPNARATVPRGINVDGVIVGWMIPGDSGSEQGFICGPNPQARDFVQISYPLASSTKAFGNSEFVTAIGSVTNPRAVIPGTHGFTFTGANFSNPIDADPFKENTVCFGINTGGVIVGTYYEQSGMPHGFVYDGVIHFINPPQFFPYMSLTGINNKSQFVGFAIDNFGGNFGFVYTYTGFIYNQGTFSFFDPPPSYSLSQFHSLWHQQQWADRWILHQRARHARISCHSDLMPQLAKFQKASNNLFA